MDRVFVYMEYCKLIDEIMVLHSRQAQIRYQTSKILFGIGAIVIILFLVHLSVPKFQPLFTAFFVPWIGVLLIHRQLSLDLRLNEKIRTSYLEKAVLKEKQFEWLPSFNSHMCEEEVRPVVQKKIIGFLGVLSLIFKKAKNQQLIQQHIASKKKQHGSARKKAEYYLRCVRLLLYISIVCLVLIKNIVYVKIAVIPIIIAAYYYYRAYILKVIPSDEDFWSRIGKKNV